MSTRGSFLPKKIFNLKHVSAQEADEVRALLRDNAIEFYETFENAWRTSVPALWLHNAADYGRARELIDCYQLQREQVRRDERRAGGDDGSSGAKWRVFRADFMRQPFKFIAFIFAIAVVMLLSVRPFFLID